MTDNIDDNLVDDKDKKENRNNTDDDLDVTEVQKTLSAEHKKIIDALVREQLAQMKANMDKMARERDEAIKAKTRQEEEKREAELAQMEKDGKIKESLEMRLTAEKERSSILQERLDRLTRDRELSNALRGIEFRNAKAAELAEKAITEQLVKNKDGDWTHRTGAPIADFVKSFLADEDNEFLLKPKRNQGTGTPADQIADSPKSGRPKSLQELTGPELLALARAGKL